MVGWHLLVFVVGLAGLTYFADRFVVGAAQVAARLQVSTVVTGALIIGFGTSAPELVVSTLAAATEGAEGTALAVGNIVGSNVANLTLVLAVPALVFGNVLIQRGVRRMAALSASGVTIFAALLLFVGPSLRWGGVLLLLTAAALRVVLWLADYVKAKEQPSFSPAAVGAPDIWVDRVTGDYTPEGSSPWVRTVIGLGATVGFASLVVWSATLIAHDLGWTGGFVGFALVAVGTSLPELVTALAAARRRQTGLILGNLLGSNLFNSLMVGGAVFLANGATPYHKVSALPDEPLLVMVVVSWGVIVLMIPRPGWWPAWHRSCQQGVGKINRAEAVILIAIYAGLVAWSASRFATV